MTTICSCFETNTENLSNTIPITPLCKNDFEKWLETQSNRIKNISLVNDFSAKPNTFLLITDLDGNLEKVLLGIESFDDYCAFGALPFVLPSGTYYIDAPNFSDEQHEHAAIGWGMGCYQFTTYKKRKILSTKLLCNKNNNTKKIISTVTSIFLVRDLINTPADNMHPEKLAQEASNLAKEFNAGCNIVSGEELRKNFPAVYAVGHGSNKQPVLIDIHYGDPHDPKIALVGKGVCFDSGGLQLKSADAIMSMKKDMAGGAHVLGLARMIMEAKLPINLRIIIPTVENLISGDSLKPGDIIKTRKGLTIEVANTDAEGRLILADALTLASEWEPKLIIDIATLTGAARVALGPDIAALFTPEDKIATDVISAMNIEKEPVWRMPLYQQYLEFLKSNIADFKNVSTSKNQTGGAITAALFLQQFVDPKIQWMHFDIFAHNQTSKPGKPEGAEADCIKGLFRYIETSINARHPLFFDHKHIRFF